AQERAGDPAYLARLNEFYKQAALIYRPPFQRIYASLLTERTDLSQAKITQIVNNAADRLYPVTAERSDLKLPRPKKERRRDADADIPAVSGVTREAADSGPYSSALVS